jgi:hypothetical protein
MSPCAGGIEEGQTGAEQGELNLHYYSGPRLSFFNGPTLGGVGCGRTQLVLLPEVQT